ncbi:hypothetical protein SNE40_016200 [Patella caerulea]|uniref:Uncharacterized protein n=1 Tax=Patella caerulea TaxID=87958 RepID=A0AAN8PIH0_PATCE
MSSSKQQIFATNTTTTNNDTNTDKEVTANTIHHENITDEAIEVRPPTDWIRPFESRPKYVYINGFKHILKVRNKQLITKPVEEDPPAMLSPSTNPTKIKSNEEEETAAATAILEIINNFSF